MFGNVLCLNITVFEIFSEKMIFFENICNVFKSPCIYSAGLGFSTR